MIDFDNCHVYAHGIVPVVLIQEPRSAVIIRIIEVVTVISIRIEHEVEFS